MIKTFLTKTTAFLLCLTLLYGLTGCGLLPKFPGFPEPNPTAPSEPETTAPSESTFPVNQNPSVSVPHFDVPLEERSRNSFDSAAYDSAYQEFAALLESDGNAERIGELYEIINDLLQDSKTDAALALYDYDQDVSNGELAERYSSMQSSYSSVYDKSVQLFRSAFSTAYADTLRMQIGDILADKFEAAATVSEEENALKARIRELERTYDTLARQGADSLAFKELYIELVNANNAYARLRGHENYASYAYSKGKGRDYTIEDIRGIESEVVTGFIPVYRAYVRMVTKDVVYDAYKENHDSGEVKFSKLKGCIENISPKLVESLEHLIRNRLYDVEFSDTKGQSDYTVALPSYHDAYIFINPQNKMSDYKTILHEFGHYNALYYRAGDAFDPNLVMDVEEIMSQGLQLLCYDYYDAYNEEYGRALAQSTVFQIMRSVPKGFAVNEAEYLCYTAPDLTLEKLDDIWSAANKKYAQPLGKTEDAWTAIPHVFQQPFYYIGYATSSLAAFELFVKSREDFRQSVEQYLAIAQLPAGTGFLTALRSAGLDNIFEKGRITALSEELADILLPEQSFSSPQP